ncbi:MAG: MurR/RpiR family transcriptional regulator [Lentisphaerae bacterium]|nr:MurR/RpiR family transcriptional regulator [Lentisphaerota bacterium]
MTTGNIDYRTAIQTGYNSLGAKKRIIADYVLENPMKVISSSVQELAKICDCDQTTIVRFAQQLGFRGYMDLKIAIARQLNSVWAEFTDTKEGEDAGILKKLASRHVNALQNTLASLDEKLLEDICDILEKSSHILAFGAGTSQLAAIDLQIKFLRLGLQIHCFADIELTKTLLGYARENGIIFLFSQSGETEIVTMLAKLAKEEHIPVVAITSFPGSTLALQADYVLVTACSNEPQIRFGVMSARLAQLAVVDALTLLFSMRNQERSWEFIAKGYHDNVE